MILSTTIKPENTIYVHGANIITILKEQKFKNINIEVLYTYFIRTNNQEMSMTNFLYVLDWLFILGVILYKDNKIKICI